MEHVPSLPRVVVTIVSSLALALGVPAAAVTPVHPATAAEQVALVTGIGESLLQTGSHRVGHGLARITFPMPMRDPVVVVGAPTRRGIDPVVAQVAEVDPHGFSVRLAELPYLDGGHAREDVIWVAVERGAHVIDGALVTASSVSVGADVVRHDFPVRFDAAPVVIATTRTEDAADPHIVRLHAVTRGRVDLRLQSQEAGPPPVGATVGVVAFTPRIVGDAGPWVTAERRADHWPKKVPVEVVDAVCLLAQQQTTIGLDPAGTRLDRRPGVWRVMVDEDRSVDAEIAHAKERVGFVALPCTDPTPVPAKVGHVVVIVVDGLRPDAIDAVGPGGAPTLHRLLDEGASTLRARTDVEVAKTLPGHTSMLTGRPVGGPAGHGVTENVDTGGSVHDLAGQYVPSVFDVVHDREGRTALLHGKDKLRVLERSWDTTAATPRDTIGGDDGRDKIDLVLKAPVAELVTAFIAEPPAAFTMLTMRDTDVAGHANGWMTPEYLAALTTLDAEIARVVAHVETDPMLAGDTAIILTADHGGDGDGHADEDLATSYRVPMIVWAPGDVGVGDLYALNGAVRTDPGDGQPLDDGAAPPPIRIAEVGNLALQLLGLPAISGSVYGVLHDLVLPAP